MIRKRLKTAYIQQKSYANNRRRVLEYVEGHKVYLKISPMKGVVTLEKKWKLSPRYVGPYDVFNGLTKLNMS